MIQAAKILVISLVTGIGINPKFSRYLSIAYLILLGVEAGILLASLISGVPLSFDILDLNNLMEAYNLECGGNVMFIDHFEMPMPGVKCPTCAARGLEQWVLPGKHCPRCSTAC